MQRDNALDAVKGFAILLVMAGHCIVLNGLNATDPYIYDAIKSVQMPLFMLVSGIANAPRIIASPACIDVQEGANAPRARASERSGLSKLKRRAVSYLVPFFSWFVLVYLATHLLQKEASVSGFLTELKQLLLQTDRGLWFLMTLFVVTTVTMIAQTLADTLCDRMFGVRGKNIRRLLFLVFSGVFYLLFFVQGRSGNTFLSPSLTLQYFPFYLFGYVVRSVLEEKKMCHFGGEERMSRLKSGEMRCLIWICSILLLIGAAAFLGAVVALDLTAPVSGIADMLGQMAVSLAGTLVVFVSVYMFARKREKKTGRRTFLAWIGTYTLEIYVLHFRFARLLGLSEKHLQMYSLRGQFWLLAAFAVMSVCTAVSIVLIRQIPVLSFLLFGKKTAFLQDVRKGHL